MVRVSGVDKTVPDCQLATQWQTLATPRLTASWPAGLLEPPHVKEVSLTHCLLSIRFYKATVRFHDGVCSVSLLKCHKKLQNFYK